MGIPKGYVSVKTLMQNITQLFFEAQQIINQKNLELTEKLVASEKKGFSLQDDRLITVIREGHSEIIHLTEMISHHHHKISELSIQFAILETRGWKRRPLFQIVPFEPHPENAKRAVINIRASEKTTCEFSIDDKIVATL